MTAAKGRRGYSIDRAQRPPNHSNNHGRRATRPLYDASAENEPIPVSLTRSGCSFQSGRASAPMIPQPVQTMRAPNVGPGRDPATDRRSAQLGGHGASAAHRAIGRRASACCRASSARSRYGCSGPKLGNGSAGLRPGHRSLKFYTPLKRDLKLWLVRRTWPPVLAHPHPHPSLNWRPPAFRRGKTTCRPFRQSGNDAEPFSCSHAARRGAPRHSCWRTASARKCSGA